MVASRWLCDGECPMVDTASVPPGAFVRLVDEQLELAASRMASLEPLAVHPSPADHDEITTPHTTLEDVLLGNAQPTATMLEELAALEAAPEISDEELARQALADGGADGNPATPE